MLAGLALAGGASRRMGGGDKPLLEIEGRPILSYVLGRLQDETDVAAISANGDPARFAAFSCPVLSDGEFAGRGPLAGVLAGLEWADRVGAQALLTIPADTPFSPPGLARKLAPPPAWAASGDRVHRLVALWPVVAKAMLRQFLAGPGPFAVHGFGAMVGMRTVWFPDRPYDLFLNVNTPAELEAARRVKRSLAL